MTSAARKKASKITFECNPRVMGFIKITDSAPCYQRIKLDWREGRCFVIGGGFLFVCFV